MEELCRKYPQHKEELTERAAIMEYHGEMNRDDANNEASKLIKMKYGLYEQKGLFEDYDG
jgi:hypothetical protein